MTFKIKYIGPKKDLDVDKVRLEMLNELRKQARIFKKDFNLTTRTWKHKPEFKEQIHLGAKEASVEISTEDDIYKFVDQGTSIRWAVMSRDWKSKTRSQVIGSTRGRGRAVIWGRGAMRKRHIRPRPGIKARKFSKTIVMIRKTGFTKGMQNAIKRGLRNAWS